jgi:hypothetical protein
MRRRASSDGSTKSQAPAFAGAASRRQAKFQINSSQRYLKFLDAFPSPFSMGEGEGGGGHNKDPLVPPPLHPLPRGEGRFLGCFEKMLEENSRIYTCRNPMIEIQNFK